MTIGLLVLPMVTACPRPEPAPAIRIDVPQPGSTLPAGDITVTVSVSGFRLVDKLGQSSRSGEGHIHYYIDVAVPTEPGRPAVTAPGTYAASASNRHTWTGVQPGEHTFSAQLVNNDHTPLSPPATASVTATVSDAVASVTLDLTTRNVAFDKEEIRVPPGAIVTINFHQEDVVPHNFAVYKVLSARPEPVFVGEIMPGGSTVIYRFTAPEEPGTYLFQCDVHPGIMEGRFVVTVE